MTILFINLNFGIVRSSMKSLISVDLDRFGKAINQPKSAVKLFALTKSRSKNNKKNLLQSKDYKTLVDIFIDYVQFWDRKNVLLCCAFINIRES